MSENAPGGTLHLANDLSISRMGYGALQLAGPHAMGPPKDHDEAIAVLREAVQLGITHIDTAGFYGPAVTNEIIKKALHPYPEGLRIVTKVGAYRPADGSWVLTRDPGELRHQVRENLQQLGVEALDVVNLRLGTAGGEDAVEESLAEPFGVLAELREQGLIRHLGLSTVTANQLAQAQAIAPVVTVQNFYNLANRQDEELLAHCAAEGIAYVPFFPLGGFTPLQSDTLTSVATRLGTSVQQVALAWLLQHSPTIAMIPGTSTVAHLRDNVAAAELTLPADAVAELDNIGK